MFGITRDRLVVEFKGSDRVYVDSEDIGLIRKYTGGETPRLSKMMVPTGSATPATSTPVCGPPTVSDAARAAITLALFLAYELGCKGCTTYRPNEITGAVLGLVLFNLMKELRLRNG